MNSNDDHDDDNVLSGMFKFRKDKMQENEFLLIHLLQQTYAGNVDKIRIPNIIVTSICKILVSAE